MEPNAASAVTASVTSSIQGAVPAVLFALVLGIAAPAGADQRCAWTARDREWLAQALAAWDKVRADDLRLAPTPRPRIVLFDRECQWDVPADAPAIEAVGTAHDGTVTAPDGNTLPPVLNSFAGAYGPERRPFVVMSAPAIWRSEERLRSDPHLELLLRSVLVHELTHVVQTPVLGPVLDALSQRLDNPDELTDDVIQTVFGDDAAFRAAYERERDLLYAAAAERDGTRRAALTAQAVAAIEARRAQFFTGNRAFYQQLEDVFLVMEGAANWAAYRVGRNEGLSDAEAQALIRRGRRNWSQDGGLGLFLLLEANGAPWRREVFAPTVPSVTTLLR